MAKSRRLPALLPMALFLSLPAASQPAPPPDAPTIVTADEAIAMDRARMRDLIAIDCPPGREGEEVIVCGRRPGFPRYRVPMADPDIGPRGRDRAAAAQLEAMAADDQACPPG